MNTPTLPRPAAALPTQSQVMSIWERHPPHVPASRFALNEAVDLLNAKDYGLRGIAASALMALDHLDDPIAVKAALTYIAARAFEIGAPKIEHRVEGVRW